MTIKIEIGQYRESKKESALKAFFTLCIYDPEGGADRQYTDCQYFVHGDREWWTFAQKVVKQEDGSKPKYFSYTRYMNKAYVDELQNTVLSALKSLKKASNDNSYAHPTAPSPVQSETSFTW